MANSHVHLPSCLVDIHSLAIEKLAISILFPCRDKEVVFMATDIALSEAVDWVMMQLCPGHCAMLVLEQERQAIEGTQ
ncbi:unnamed protein product [Taenia asiatica]|uniref:Uncharacterized protein n=1 Tax=Taenia asiatica TaxID=60517 RepID=A0A0R3W088_TAEAS|nr:unnamed protein product [Taenia asiatica]